MFIGLGIIKEEFVANVVQAEMQRCDLYIARHATRATNATTFYQAKHEIVDNDLV